MSVTVRQSYMTGFGKMHITRGTGVVFDDNDKPVAQIKLYSWDVLPICRGEDCPARSTCNYYEQRSESNPERCMVVGRYLKSLTDVVLGNLGSKMTEIQLFRFGTSLVPLYKNMARLKIEEAGQVSPMVTSKMGNQIPNPIYKEIREHIKIIDHVWKNINLQTMDEGANMTDVELPLTEDISYYDQLEQQIAGEVIEEGAIKSHSRLVSAAEKAKRTGIVNKKLKIRRSVFSFDKLYKDNEE